METKINTKKYKTVAHSEEQHLVEMSTTTTKTLSKKSKKVKTSLKKSTVNVEENVEQISGSWASENIPQRNNQEVLNNKDPKLENQKKVFANENLSEDIQNVDINENKKKSKSKKGKKSESDKQNISVKSSFSKFDALQKRNLIHVRSYDTGKAQEKFSNPQEEKETHCRLCAKPVYTMEEIKAEKSIYHKNCFRCRECNKQLKVDNYQSHEGVPYCIIHFKLLFAPKTVEETEPEKPRKPELIIRENEPTSLPPGVVRASDKPDLGLEDLHQLNVRSRFQVFENGVHQKPETTSLKNDTHVANVKRSTSILSKVAKLHAHGLNASINGEFIDHIKGSSDSENGNSSICSEDDVDDDIDDVDLVHSKKRTSERPVGIGKAMEDIKTKFEKGPYISKDERREERKQEIQNIRSRLFMGKQARIKEMYQQAVAESEQGVVSVGKKPEVEVDGVARALKERFEKGEMFSGKSIENEVGHHIESAKGLENEAAVFESAISKQSRSIFMELDEAAGKNKSSFSLMPKERETKQNTKQKKNTCEFETENCVKCDDKPDDVKIETSEISEKFKFFEKYRPAENKKKEFRITPPREGVVKMPSPDDKDQDLVEPNNETFILEKSRTTAKMINKFREMEQKKNRDNDGPRPLKCFTPPPDEGRQVYQQPESDQESDEDVSSEEDEDDDETKEALRRARILEDDEALKEAQAAARAKQLRAKFEKWESDEIQRELRDGNLDIYSEHVSDNTNIESAKSIRERFENMKNSELKTPVRPRYQVNRFV